MTPTKTLSTIEQSIIIFDMLTALGFDTSKMTIGELFDVKRAITEATEKIGKK